jgi:preprotein translocase subunit SecD
MRPGRQLAVLGLLFVILYLLVFFAGTGGMSLRERLEPRLGLDLVGGARVTLKATTQDGQPPPADNLEEARQIIENRVNGLGVSEAEVVTQGNTNIVISKAGEADDQLREVGEPAQLRFRKMLKVTDGSGAATATPTPSAGATPGATPSASANPDAESVEGSPGASAPATDPSAAASAPATEPSASAAPVPAQDAAARLAAVRAKVGPAAWAAAEKLTEPDTTNNAALKPFEKLSAVEVAALPANIQFNVPQVSCEKLDERPPGSIEDPKARVVACEAGGKYLLDVAKVIGTDIDDASPQLDQNGKRVVSLDFKSEGGSKWTALTREAYNNSGAEDQKCAEQTLGSEKRCRVAVVLDNTIVSSPEILGVLSGGSQISGEFSATEANQLASQLRFGALPLTFVAEQAQTISASLGAEHLRAGLLAAGIGMLLVIIYSFFYYRLLGTVIFLSLILSALLVFGALVVLGRQIGFTLTLAGIAGLIVSLGVAADSFVIYFERLKDEIREGRSPRSAVPRAWVRARRTIISANAITILAAVVLYVVSVGTVQGFAFALGLATILDLVVVFLFRHPIMAMFARTKAFMSPRVSGLGRVLQREGDAAADVRKSRPKEA